MNAVCPFCYAKSTDSLLCAACTRELTTDLRGNASVMGVAELVDNLHIAQAKESRLTASSGHETIKHERLVVNVGAMEALRHLDAILTSWARDVTNDTWWPGLKGKRARRIPGSAPGPFCPRCVHPSCQERRQYESKPCPERYQSVDAAETLLDHMNDIRSHDAARELMDEITKAVARGRALVDPQRTAVIRVGPCPEDGCTNTVFAFLPADESSPATMACKPLTEDKQPDRGVPSPHTWETHQWLRASRRILDMIARTKRNGAAA